MLKVNCGDDCCRPVQAHPRDTLCHRWAPALFHAVRVNHLLYLAVLCYTSLWHAVLSDSVMFPGALCCRPHSQDRTSEHVVCLVATKLWSVLDLFPSLRLTRVYCCRNRIRDMVNCYAIYALVCSETWSIAGQCTSWSGQHSVGCGTVPHASGRHQTQDVKNVVLCKQQD